MLAVILAFILSFVIDVESCSSSVGQSIWGSHGSYHVRNSAQDTCKSTSYETCSKADLVNGRDNAIKISFELYHGVSLSKKMKERNLFFLPMEIASIISLVLDGAPSTNSGNEQMSSSLLDMRCYVRDLRKGLNQNVLVDTSVNNNYHKAVMMLIQRKLFADKKLNINFKYAKDTLCWYDVPINRLDFKDIEETQEHIDDWAMDEATRAEKYIMNLTSSKKEISVGHPALSSKIKVIKESKIIIASSTIFKLAWMNKLFCSKHTIPKEPFYTKMNSKDGTETIVRVPFMKTKGKFPFVENEDYKAITLPLDASIHKGGVLFVMPKKNESFSELESKLLQNYASYQDIIKSMNSLQNSEKEVEVLLPVMNIRISQEFAIPAKQNMRSIKDEKGKPISGDKIHVYQDTYMEMMESSSDCHNLPKANESNTIIFNSPFLMFVEIREDLIGYGRIQNPKECFDCPIVDEVKEEEKDDYLYIDIGRK